MIDGISPILWVDTIHLNINRYIERYFLPLLFDLNPYLWKWEKQAQLIRVGNSVCDFRSAEHPENIEGFGYSLIILNEAGIILNDPYLWYNAIQPMILDYNSPMLIGGTPKGILRKHTTEPHIFYELYKKGLSGVPHWQSFKFSSYDNPYLDREEIDALVKETPHSIRRQEIFADFVDVTAGEIIKREWWRYYKTLPMEHKGLFLIGDTAHKRKTINDPSGFHVWMVTNNGYYLVHRWVERVEFPELKRQTIALYNKFNPVAILIEDKSSGQDLIPELRRGTTMPIIPITPTTDKVSRATMVTPIIEAGNCYLPEDAPWLSDFLDSVSGFPNAAHDEDVDILSMFLNYGKYWPSSRGARIGVASV